VNPAMPLSASRPDSNPTCLRELIRADGHLARPVSWEPHHEQP